MTAKAPTTPATYQPTKAEMVEVVVMPGTPKEIAASMFGGAPRRDPLAAKEPAPEEAPKGPDR